MKKEAQLAVLVLVMIAGLYSFDYVAGSGSQSGTFTGAVTSFNPTGQPTTESFAASPSTISKDAQVTLTWAGIKEASTCSVRKPDGSLVKTFKSTIDIDQDAVTVAPAETTTYELKCFTDYEYGSVLTTSLKATVTVTQAAATSTAVGTTSGTSTATTSNALCTEEPSLYSTIMWTCSTTKKVYNTQGQCNANCKPAAAGTTGAASQVNSQYWQLLADAIYKLYTPGGKITYDQYNKAYYALAKGEPLPTDVAAKLPKGNRESIEKQRQDNTITYEQYLAAYYALLYSPESTTTQTSTPPSSGSSAGSVGATGSSTGGTSTATTSNALCTEEPSLYSTIMWTCSTTKKVYNTLGQCNANCPTATGTTSGSTTGTETTGGSSSGNTAGSTGSSSSATTSSTSQDTCEVNNAQGKVICKSGDPKTEYGNQLGECRSNCKPTAAGTTGATSGGSSSGTGATTPTTGTTSPGTTGGSSSGAGTGAAASSEAANLVIGDLGLGRDSNVVLSISNLGKKNVPTNILAVAVSIKKDGMVVCMGEGYLASSLDAGKNAAVVASMKDNAGASAQCSLQAGQSYVVEATVDSKGLIPETSESDNKRVEQLTFGTSAPAVTCTAYTVGFRTQDGKYCDASGNAVAQKAGSQACYNSFECSSNFCAAGQCIETSVLKKTFCYFGAASLC